MKKKGFTLIELLAVIVILAIIALIATPMIMDVIEKARKGAAIESVNGILEAAGTYYMEKLIDQSAAETTIDLAGDTLTYKGSKPESGTLIVGEKGRIYIIAKYGNYCIEKNFDSDKPEVVDNENCESKTSSAGYVNGTEVYFNPSIGTVCTKEEAEANILEDGIVENQDGCMKWYIFNDTEEATTVNLLASNPLGDEYDPGRYLSYNQVKAIFNQKLASITTNWSNTYSIRLMELEEVEVIISHQQKDVFGCVNRKEPWLTTFAFWLSPKIETELNPDDPVTGCVIPYIVYSNDDTMCQGIAETGFGGNTSDAYIRPVITVEKALFQ